MKSINKLLKLEFFILFILTIILIKNLNFFKNTYLIFNKNLIDRYQKVAFDFCENNSSGYIFYIKEKFKLQDKPQIINYNIEPEQNWIFHKDNIFKKSKNIILLNYIQNITYNFKKNYETGLWVSYDMATPNTTFGASHLEFVGDYYDNNNKNFKIEFYKKEIAVLKDVDKLKFTVDKDLDSYSELGKISFRINKNQNKHRLIENKINFNDHDSIKIIKLDDDFDDQKIDTIKLFLKEKINLSKYKILDNYNNKCMYLSYNE